MLSRNGPIDYSVEAHTLDAHKTSAARQESTTRNLHGSAASTFHGSAAQNLYRDLQNTSLDTYLFTIYWSNFNWY